MHESTSYLLAFAEQQLAHGNALGAQESVRRFLAEDPDHSSAHAMLAIALYIQRRLHAAEHEAGLAVALDPDSAYARHALGLVKIGKRDFRGAEEHLEAARAMAGDQPAIQRALATLYGLTGRDARVIPTLSEALALDPRDAATLAALGEAELAAGNLKGAAARALEALQIDAENVDALVLMGQVMLRRGDVDDARDHAVQALRLDPTNRGALFLLAGVKARRNPFLGLWWRYSVWMEALGTSRSILVLLAAFAVYRVLTAMAQQNGWPNAVGPIQIAWLGIVIYTWVGPALFKKSLDKELRPVALDDKF
jgi:Flp pilus assembly protein TadD